MSITNTYCDLGTAGIDMFIFSALLKSSISISSLTVNNVTNPLVYLLSSTMVIANSDI